MREPADALRSFKRHIAVTLGDEWEVRLTGEEGAFNRPFARVGIVGDFVVRGQRAWMAEWRGQFEVICHPVEKATPDEARLEAERVRMLLYDALRAVGGGASMPKRIPLWDYAGVAVAQDVVQDIAERDALVALGVPAAALVIRPRAANDYLRADTSDEPTLGVIPDPGDEMMYAVVGTSFLNWTRAISIADPSPVATGLGVAFPPGP